MAITMTPLTSLIMSSVPLGKAGVGSAMNDTTRELGGALGVAVLGSLVTSQYASGIGPDLVGLPEEARQVAESGLSGALQVGSQIGGEQGASLIAAVAAMPSSMASARRRSWARSSCCVPPSPLASCCLRGGNAFEKASDRPRSPASAPPTSSTPAPTPSRTEVSSSRSR